MKPLYVYVAGPYTKGDVILNIRHAIEVGDNVRSLGHIPFIPHMTYAWHMQHPHDIDFWYKYDLEWLLQCDVLLRIPGESTGADREVEYAKAQGIPVFNTMAELIEYGGRI